MKSEKENGVSCGLPSPQPSSEDAAVGQAEQAVDDLPVAVGIGERGEPRVEAHAHVPEGQVAEPRTAGEQHAADQQPAGTLGGDVEHDHEQPEEQQGRPEVALEHEDRDAHQPAGQDGSEVAPAGEVDAGEASTGQGEGVALDHQVAGEEDREADLGRLTGLEAERSEVDPDARAVDGAADDRQQREDQQRDGGEPERVGERLEPAVVAHGEQDAGERRDADDRPDRAVSWRTPPGSRRAGCDRGRGGRSSPGRGR